MRFVATVFAGLAALAITAAASFFAVMTLAGPHGGLLPQSMHTAVLLLAWAMILVVPIVAARWVWRRFAA